MYNPRAYRKPSLRVAVIGGDLSGRRLLCVTGSAFYRQTLCNIQQLLTVSIFVRWYFYLALNQ
ncbi:hypothetical protein QQ39_06640 [Pragia fontium]|nr:hypothetical protein QQ39_06640 [Pragia fontium]